MPFGGGMPKSRGRKRAKRQRKPARGGHPAYRDLGEFAPYLRVLRAVDAAEARGDARGALDLMSQHPLGPDGRPFWKPERWRRLAQIWVFGPLLPRWAISRWIVAQAAQHLDVHARGRQALDTALRVRSVPASAVDLDEDARIRIMDHDWVFRQVLLYEFGGLEHFVRREARPGLLADAEPMQEWFSPPMGGFVLEARSGRTLAWRHLGSGDGLLTLNLGSSSLLSIGDHVIGRPVTVAGGALFESVPLEVSAAAALRVARDPHGWIDAVAGEWRHAQEKGTPGFDTHVQEFGLLTDVPDWIRCRIARGPVLTGSRGSEEEWEDHVQHDIDLVMAALELDDLAHELGEDDPWPAVAAALLEPGTYPLLRERLTTAEATSLVALADELPDPAAELCRLMAAGLRGAA
jgi:hypothetical protein